MVEFHDLRLFPIVAEELDEQIEFVQALGRALALVRFDAERPQDTIAFLSV